MQTINNSRHFNDLKVALVYDHLTTSFGGAELVLQTLHSIFPSAPIYTSVYDIETNDWAKSYEIHTSFLQKIPFIRKHHQLLALFHPLAFESFDLSTYDIIISVSNGPSKGVITLPHQLHLCYMLNPTRYLTLDATELNTYIKSQPLLSFPGIKTVSAPFLRYLKRWDFIAAQRPDVVIAISKLVASRIENSYNRAVSKVIYPPFTLANSEAPEMTFPPFFLSLTRLTSYKRVDLAIKASLKKNHLLIIAGDGVQKGQLLALAKDHAYLRSKGESLASATATASDSKKSILFLGAVSEIEKHQLLKNCHALLMPGEEDFGLVGLEAAAYGKPTITYYKSGIAEVLKEGQQAIFTREKTVAAVEQALERFLGTRFDPKKIALSVKEYETDWFKELFHKTIYHFWQQHSTIAPVDKK